MSVLGKSSKMLAVGRGVEPRSPGSILLAWMFHRDRDVSGERLEAGVSSSRVGPNNDAAFPVPAVHFRLFGAGVFDQTTPRRHKVSVERFGTGL